VKSTKKKKTSSQISRENHCHVTMSFFTIPRLHTFKRTQTRLDISQTVSHYLFSSQRQTFICYCSLSM